MPNGTEPATTNTKDALVRKFHPLTGQEDKNTLDKLTLKLIVELGLLVIKEKGLDNESLSNPKTLKNEIYRTFVEGLTIPKDSRKLFKKDLINSFESKLDSKINELILFVGLLRIGKAVVSSVNEFAIRLKEYGADPVMLFNGQFTHSAQDLTLNGAGIDFAFMRTYKNQAAYKGPLGHNWDHNYNLWLRVSEDEQAIVRSTGTLREDTFNKHPVFNYWVPPNGDDGVIFQKGTGFIYRMTNGTRFLYQQHSQELALVHVIDRIEDRFGNTLRFFYEDGLLRFAQVNHAKRKVEFKYDAARKICAIEDFTGRVWRYTYDDFEDLIAVTTPGTGQYPEGLTTCFEYSSSQFTGSLQHNLVTILDAKGQMYLENKYGSDPGFLGFNRVVRQRSGGGETLFEYEDVIEEFEFDYGEHERPAHQTTMIDRNGQVSRHMYNKFGNLLFKEECVILKGLPKLLRSHFRYNRDGNLVAALSPEGVMRQYLYGRELFARQRQIDDEVEIINHDDLTIRQRQSFNRLLASVRRNKYFQLSDLNLSRDVWGDMFPDIFGAIDLDEEGNSEDIIIKFSYEPVYGQILSKSDPRFTNSPDPNAINEHPLHQVTLTKYEYADLAGDPDDPLVLKKVIRPTPTLPDGTPGTEIVELFEEYDPNGRLLRYRNPVETEVENTYFPEDPNDPREGYLQRTIVDAGGLEISTAFGVDELGRVTETHLPRFFAASTGHFITKLEYDELDQVTKMMSSEPFGFEVRNFYNCNNNLERIERDVKDEEGNNILDAPEVQTFEYDEDLNLTEATIGGSDLSDHLVTRHRYNSSSKIAGTILPKGNQIRYSYDERLFAVAVTAGVGSDDSSTSRTEYDGDGRIIRVRDARGNLTDFTLDAFGRIISEEDALGNITFNTYDKANNLRIVRSFERREEGSYFLLSRNEIDYDELNRPVRTGINRFDEPLGPLPKNELEEAFLVSPGPGKLLISETFYDEQSRIVRVVDPLGREMVYVYDALGRTVSVADPFGNRIENRYDAHNNVIRSDQIDLVRDTENGNVTGKRVFSNSYTYDELDRVTGSTDSLGNTTKYFYDSRNNLVKTVDPLGNVIRSEFDIYGRKISETMEQTATGLGGGAQLPPAVNRYIYDENSNVIEVADALERRTKYELDALDRRRAIIYPDNSTFLIAYDTNSNLIRTKDNNGLQRHFTFDELNRMVRVDVDDSELDPDIKVEGCTFEEYKYDGLDRQVSEKNDFAHCEIRYNSLSWPLNETLSFTTVEAPFDDQLLIAREFDDVGEAVGLTYPNGRKLQFERDNLDRLTRIRNLEKGTDYSGNPNTPNEHDIVRMEYLGQERGRCVLGNGLNTRYAHDGAARIIEITHGAPSNSLLTIQYLYDAVGNMRLRHDIKPSGNSAEKFDYDSFYRLVNIRQKNFTSFNPVPLAPLGDVNPGPVQDRQIEINNLIGLLALPGGEKTFDYDLVGNREREKTDGGNSKEYTVNNLDQYTSIDGADVTYDNNGNAKRDGNKEYIYDSLNRLVRVTDIQNDEDIARFFHDSRGRRILEIVKGQTTHLICNGFNLISEYRNGKPFVQYVHDDGIDRPVQIAAEGSEHWYHSDLVSSVRLLTDQNGEAAESYVYSPFGEITSASGNRLYNLLRYNARRFDEALGSYDYRARQYDPLTGRFLQRDPKEMVDGTNLYQFTANNPLSFVDPFGTEREERCENPYQIKRQKRLDSSQLTEWARRFDFEREEQYERWREGIRWQEISDNMLVATVEGNRKNKAWRDYVHNQTILETRSNYNRNIVGALAGQAASNWTDDPNIIRGASGIGAAFGDMAFARGINNTLRGPHKLPVRRGRVPSLRKWWRSRREGRRAAGRAKRTRELVGGDVVILSREVSIATGKETFRHDIYRTPALIYAKIEKEGLRLSYPGAQTAKYGVGAYAWPEGVSNTTVAHINFSVKPGTAVEKITIQGNSHGPYTVIRLVPAEGSHIGIKIHGTNLSNEAINQGRNFNEKYP